MMLVGLGVQFGSSFDDLLKILSAAWGPGSVQSVVSRVNNYSILGFQMLLSYLIPLF